MDTVLHDLRFAARMLRKAPVVTAAAILSLALGIGANTTIFTMVNAIFLRPLPFPDADRLVAVFTTEEAQQFGRFMPVSRPNYEDLATLDVFDDLINMIFVPASVSAGAGEPESVGGQIVSGRYFDTLGARAAIGRTFSSDEDSVPGGHPVMVLSHRWWTTRFGADPDIAGTVVTVNLQPFTIIGVMPEDFTGTFLLGTPSFWAPVSMYETFLTGTFLEWFEDRRALLTQAFGKLRDGVTVAQANSALEATGQALESNFPNENKNRRFVALPLALATINPAQRDAFSRAGWVLMAIVGLVLLIACVNVANLLLGRAAARRREVGVRIALGAPRGRLIRQLLIESLMLSLLAGGIGLLIAYWGRKLLWSFRPPFLQGSNIDLSFDPRVLLFTVAVSILTGVLFGLVPALQATRPRVVSDLVQTSDSAAGSLRLFSIKNALVMLQVLISFLVLLGSGLFLRSLGAATEIDVGFEPDVLATVNLAPASNGYDEARGEAFFTEAVETARRVPGVRAASLGTALPLNGGGMWRTVIVEGRDEDAANNRILTPANTVDPGYFRTLGVSVLEGRDFTDQDRDDATSVVVVNEAFVDFFFPDEPALHKRFSFFDHGGPREIVGIVRDTKYNSLGEDPQPQAYMPRRQNYVGAMTLVFRSDGDPETVLSAVRGEVQQLDANLPLTGVQPMTAAVEASLWPARMGAGLLGLLGLLALVLAAIGIYGVMAYSVGLRRRELSIRMAMGARRGDVLRLVLGHGMTIAAIGVGFGIALALAIVAWKGTVLGELLYGVSPADIVTFCAVLVVLLVVAFLANFVPAQRAASTNPVQALRFER